MCRLSRLSESATFQPSHFALRISPLVAGGGVEPPLPAYETGALPLELSSHGSWSPRRDSNSRLHPNRGCVLYRLSYAGSFKTGGPGENRTPTLPLKRRALFQLSYRPRTIADCGLWIADFGFRIVEFGSIRNSQSAIRNPQSAIRFPHAPAEIRTRITH